MVNNNFIEKVNSLEDLSAIYLLLGPSCNMSCRHCTQNPIKETYSLPPIGNTLSQRVIEFILDWSKLPWRFSINRRIYFWGGEPLLYWETIKNIIIMFESKDIKNVEWRIFSNGLLLTEDIVKFCNKHGVLFMLSYDSPNSLAVRNKVPSEEKCNLFLQIKKRVVNSVFSAVNQDMKNGLEILEKKFPATPITYGFINVIGEIPKDIYSFKKGEVRASVYDLSVKESDGDKNAQRWFWTKMGRVNFDRKYFIENPFPACHPSLISLSIKFNGDVVLCHNTNYKVGNISDSFSVLQENHKKIFKELLPPNCLRCEYLDICRGGCPIALKTDNGEEFVCCSWLREFWKAIKDVAKGIPYGGE